MEKKILASWQRCKSIGLSKDIVFPVIKVTPQQFKVICSQNKMLISTFKTCITELKAHLTGAFLFLLTDAQGILLDIYYNKDIEQHVKQSQIKPSMSFAVESCGTNAVSMAMDTGESIYILPEQHYCSLFKCWHCFCTPILMNNKIIGYLDISTINTQMKKEFVAITKILPSYLIDKYKKQLNQYIIDMSSVKLTKRQMEILTLITRGLSAKEIAIALKIKECTVDYHKKVLFEKLNVNSSTEAAAMAARLKLIP